MSRNEKLPSPDEVINYTLGEKAMIVYGSKSEQKATYAIKAVHLKVNTVRENLPERTFGGSPQIYSKKSLETSLIVHSDKNGVTKDINFENSTS